MNKPKFVFNAKCNRPTEMDMWNAKYFLLYFAIVLKIEGSVSARLGASSVAVGGTASDMEGICEYIE
jgi:hypothetical protein